MGGCAAVAVELFVNAKAESHGDEGETFQ